MTPEEIAANQEARAAELHTLQVEAWTHARARRSEEEALALRQVLAAEASAAHQAALAGHAKANQDTLAANVEFEQRHARHRLLAEILERRVTDRTASGAVDLAKCSKEAWAIFEEAQRLLTASQTPVPAPVPAPATPPAPVAPEAPGPGGLVV